MKAMKGKRPSLDRTSHKAVSSESYRCSGDPESRNSFREGVKETADLTDDGLWVAEGLVKGFQEVGKDEGQAETEKGI